MKEVQTQYESAKNTKDDLKRNTFSKTKNLATPGKGVCGCAIRGGGLGGEIVWGGRKGGMVPHIARHLSKSDAKRSPLVKGKGGRCMGGGLRVNYSGKLQEKKETTPPGGGKK